MTTNHDDVFDNKIATAMVNISTPEFLEDRRVANSYNNNTNLISQAIDFAIVYQLQNHGPSDGIWCKHGRIKICS